MKFVDFLNVWDFDGDEWDNICVYEGSDETLVLDCPVAVVAKAMNAKMSFSEDAFVREDPEFYEHIEKMRSLLNKDFSKFFYRMTDCDATGIVIFLK